jgi:hypothetical protein
MMRNLVLVVFFIFGLTIVNGQEKDKFRAGLDIGYVFADAGGGALFSIEPKYNITDNSNIGIRFGAAGSSSDSDTEVDANINILGTYDYYFSNGNSSAAPFLGGGLGYYALGELNNTISLGEQFGAMIRGGIELRKLRFAVEYNILPKTDLEFGQSVKNSYFGASIGFYVGGGKWKKGN